MIPSTVQNINSQELHGKFFVAPDVTDVQLPSKLEKIYIVEQIKRHSSGRVILLLIGGIANYKGFLTFLKLAQLMKGEKYFFVVVGKIFWNTFSKKEQEYINNMICSKQENLLIHSSYVNSEKEYNAIFQCADIVYAVYNDFDGSSNTLTKAAAFHRKVLASDGSYMGEKVREAGLGAVTDNNCVSSIIKSIETLAEINEKELDFDSYYCMHSIACLKHTIKNAVDVWVSQNFNSH